jgi:hypothetical protein
MDGQRCWPAIIWQGFISYSAKDRRGSYGSAFLDCSAKSSIDNDILWFAFVLLIRFDNPTLCDASRVLQKGLARFIRKVAQ